jgi:predicted ATPase/class 3 adenylate cyclase
MNDEAQRVFTFFFTDMDDSTRLWADFASAMPGVLERHDAFLEAAITAEGGAVVKHTGDGMNAVFTDPRAAVRAAVRAQLAFRGADWSPLPRLGVRIAVHTGEALERAGDYLGISLSHAARLRDAGHGGQILVSTTVAQRLAEEPLDDISTVDLGSHRLRGMPGKHRIYQIRHPQLPVRFASLRTLDAAAPLGVPATSFHGRAREVADLSALLEHARTVTLVGPGGAGKTRLAVEVGVEVAHRFRDGVRMIDLARADATDTAAAIAAGLGIVRRSRRSYEESIVDWLRRKRLLLVVDNCEHVLQNVGVLVGDAAEVATGVTFVCTSRQPLGFAGEVSFAVKPLAVPPVDEDDHRLADYPAVQLFAERAAAARYGFRPSPEQLRTIAGICRQLDGIPLALELAAARVRSMSVEDICRHLEPASPLLAAITADHPHHSTWLATIDWSYDLLTAETRRVFARMSVFRGSCTVDSARAVCTVSGTEQPVISALTDLADRSMLVAELDQPDSRYRMLTTLRDFAADKLTEMGEADGCRSRHAAFYVAMAEEARNGLLTDAESRWTTQLSADFGNLQAAHAWASQRNDLELEVRLLLALWNYGLQRLSPEYFRWVEEAMSALPLDSHERAPDLYGVAALGAWLRGDSHESARLCRAAFAAEEVFESGVTMPARMAAVVVTPYAPNATDPAVMELAGEIAARFLEMVDWCRGSRSPYWLVYSLVTGSLGRSMAGDVDRAMLLAGRALDAAKGSGCPTSLAWAYFGMGMALEQGEPHRAEELLDESVNMARSVDSRLILGISLSLLAVLRRRLARPLDAVPPLLELLDQWDRLGNSPQVWHAVREAAMCLADLGVDELAVTLLASVERADLVMPLLPADQAHLSSLLSELEERLGSDRFRRARNEGLTVRRAAALALARHALADVDSDGLRERIASP